jgi:hypothetical protein
MGALVAAGFDANYVGLLDPHMPGSRDVVYGLIRDAAAGKAKLCIHCADGERFTALPMADWLLTDYIGGDNYLEACDMLRSRKRLSGVGRSADEATLEQWITTGNL